MFSMRPRPVVLLCAFLIAVVLVSPFLLVAADYSLVVKGGDYVVWHTTIQGRPIRNVTGARMDILDVEDEFIHVKISTYYANGTVNVGEYTYNQLRGSMGDDLIVPRRLNVGDQFYDQYVHNITISSIGYAEFAGATRAVMYGSIKNTSFTWDRETGVLVNATSSYFRSNGVFSIINTQMESTNIWQPDTQGLPTNLLLTVAAIAVAVAVVVAVFLVWRFKGLHLNFLRRKSRYSRRVGMGAYWRREFVVARRKGLGWGEPQNKKSQTPHNNEKA